MPTLPSGLKLALYKGHIMEPDRNWVKAPEGHFWYWVPAEETPPPYVYKDDYELMPESAPVPESREAAGSYIRVLFELPGGGYFWRGEMLSEFPKYGILSDEDQHFWLEWLKTEPVEQFFDSVIAQCATQVEINKEAIGYVTILATSEGEDGTIYGNHITDNPLRNRQ